MDRGSTRSGPDQGNTSSPEGGLGGGAALATLTEVLDDGSLHGKLDEIEREEPNDVLTRWSIMFRQGGLGR